MKTIRVDKNIGTTKPTLTFKIELAT